MRHKLKRALGAVLACAMVLALLPAGALAEEGDVARIDDTTYDTLDKAIEAAADGATIELLADAETEGLNLSKDLTIQAAEGVVNPTITFTQYGIALWGKALTFKGVNVVMNGIGSTPYTAEWNWMTICASKDASLSLDQTTMTLDGDPNGTGTNLDKHAIYFCGNNKLNLSEGSNLTIKNYQQDALEWDEGDGGYNVNIIDSTYISDHNRSGFTGTFYATITNSTVNVINSIGNGSNGSHFIITDSDVHFDHNHDHGLSAGNLAISNSTVTSIGNGANGIHVTGKLEITDRSDVTITENGCTISSKWTIPGALYIAGESTIADSTVSITHNGGSGIYQKAGTLTVENTADVTITNNEAVKLGLGGGVYVCGTMNLADNVVLYNNHAGTAGDDIYNTGTIAFSPVGQGWALDGDPDCTDAIDGWYDDTEGSRWEAHDKANLHVIEFTQFGAQPTALKAAHGILPDPVPEPIVPEWETSKSKTATNLDENYESRVTLSLPSAEKELVSDVVFVLDKSTSPDLEDQALEMLDALKTQIENTGAKINVGVVVFNKVANNILELTELNDENMSKIEAAIETTNGSGTNTHAGLLAGKAMLDKDTSVDASRKYLIFVSDGITYMYDADAKIVPYYWMNDNSPYYSADPYSWQFKYGNNDAPGSWDTLLQQIGTALAGETIAPILYDNKGTLTLETATSAEGKLTAEYTTSVDRALYYTYTTYAAAQQAGYHCYAMTANPTSETNYVWGPSFMDYLAGNTAVSFECIQKDINYLLDAGSRVEDYMGYVADDYDFDFVNKASAMKLKVGDESYEAEEIAENTYGFKPVEGGYAYTLVYEAGNQKDTEHFVWTINEPVSNFAPVQLTYTVKLANPQTAPGDYGEYDEDGSQGYEGLYTNNSATLHPVDSTGNNNYVPEEFPKPTVSYTVWDTGTLHISKYVADDDADEAKEYSFLATIGDEEILFTLKDGETRTFADIPLNTDYSIWETDPQGYRPTYYNEEGTITADSPDAVAAVINVPVDEGALVISKTVNGGDLSREFTFTVELSAAGTFHYTGSREGDITGGGTVTLKNGESISINNLPEGTTYTVTETPVSGYTTTISGNDAAMQGTISGSTASGVIVSGSAAVVHYTNTYPYTPIIPDPPVCPPTTPDEPDKPELNTEDHVAYIIGYPVDYLTGEPTDDMSRWPVKPQGSITRAEVTTIFFRLLTDESRAWFWSQTNGYSDVNLTAWYNNAVSTMSSAGIVTGYPDGTFRPDAPITRAEFAAIAARFSEVIYNGGNSFTDVPENHWAARYIALAEYLGWITGYPDGSFRPDQAITRAEAMTLINRVLERDVEEEHMLEDMVKWPDNLPGAWYYEAVQEATNSHEFVRLPETVPGQDFNYEDWREILDVPDWAALERTWSTANSK